MTTRQIRFNCRPPASLQIDRDSHCETYFLDVNRRQHAVALGGTRSRIRDWRSAERRAAHAEIAELSPLDFSCGPHFRGARARRAPDLFHGNESLDRGSPASLQV